MESEDEFLEFSSNPQVYLNSDRGSITNRLVADIKIEMPINLYKKILGLPFEKNKSVQTPEATRRNIYGLVARPVIFLSQDGNYLVHSVLGIRISKHVNYDKQILGIEYCFLPREICHRKFNQQVYGNNFELEGKI